MICETRWLIYNCTDCTEKAHENEYSQLLNNKKWTFLYPTQYLLLSENQFAGPRKPEMRSARRPWLCLLGVQVPVETDHDSYDRQL